MSVRLQANRLTSLRLAEPSLCSSDKVPAAFTGQFRGIEYQSKDQGSRITWLLCAGGCHSFYPIGFLTRAAGLRLLRSSGSSLPPPPLHQPILARDPDHRIHPPSPPPTILARLLRLLRRLSLRLLFNSSGDPIWPKHLSISAPAARDVEQGPE